MGCLQEMFVIPGEFLPLARAQLPAPGRAMAAPKRTRLPTQPPCPRTSSTALTYAMDAAGKQGRLEAYGYP